MEISVQESNPGVLFEDTYIFDMLQEPDLGGGGVGDGFLSGESLQDKQQ